MAQNEIESILNLLDFQIHPQIKSENYSRFSSSQMEYFRECSMLKNAVEYPSKCMKCDNDAEVREYGNQKLLVDVKNPKHMHTLNPKEWEFYKIDIQRTSEEFTNLLRKEMIISDQFTPKIIYYEEYFEVTFSGEQGKISILVLYGSVSKETIYKILLDLADDIRGFFFLYPERNASKIEESLPFIQGQLLGMVNFSDSASALRNMKGLSSTIENYFKISKFEQQMSREIESALGPKYSDVIRKIDTNPKYLLNLIARLQIYDKQQTTWMNFERLVKLAMRYMFPGDITLGGSQDTGKPLPDSINFIRENKEVKIALIVDAKRIVKEDLKTEKTEKYENYVDTIRRTSVVRPPKICIVFVAPSFGDISDFAFRFGQKNKDVCICTLDIPSMLVALRLKLSFLLSSSIDVRDSSIESFLGKLFDPDIIGKHKEFRNHYNLDTELIVRVLESNEGKVEAMSFMNEFEKIKQSIPLMK